MYIDWWCDDVKTPSFFMTANRDLIKCYVVFKNSKNLLNATIRQILTQPFLCSMSQRTIKRSPSQMATKPWTSSGKIAKKWNLLKHVLYSTWRLHHFCVALKKIVFYCTLYIDRERAIKSNYRYFGYRYRSFLMSAKSLKFSNNSSPYCGLRL